ncbi:hypothetical protein C0993_003944, partial [Termitomyces sp. T159_Od127]
SSSAPLTAPLQYLALDSLPTLVSFLAPSPSSTLQTRSKAIYALSGLLKHNAPAVQQLADPSINGWKLLRDALSDKRPAQDRLPPLHPPPPRIPRPGPRPVHRANRARPRTDTRQLARGARRQPRPRIDVRARRLGAAHARCPRRARARAREPGAVRRGRGCGRA